MKQTAQSDPVEGSRHDQLPLQQGLRALARGFIDDVINAQDLDKALVEMVAEDFVELNPLPARAAAGPAWPTSWA